MMSSWLIGWTMKPLTVAYKLSAIKLAMMGSKHIASHCFPKPFTLYALRVFLVIHISQSRESCEWSLGLTWHAEQLLFWCVSSKVSICNHVTCQISPFTCHMLYVKCWCWSFGHAEQLLFSCLCSKVSICNYLTCYISHVRCHMSHCALGHPGQFLFSCLWSNVAVYGWK